MTYEPDIGEHQRGLRRIALRLVRDEASADDLVQETWLAALEKPPSHFDGFRSWLRTVLGHTAGRAARREARRRDSERLAARLEAEQPHERVEAVSLRAELEAALDQLGEPYASALRARYFDDLPYAEAGLALGRPADTVRTHVRRGLALLRERLARRFDGDRRALGVALIGAFDWKAEEVHLALAGKGAASAAGMALAWKALGALLVLGACVLLAWRGVAGEAERPEELALVAPPAPESAGERQLETPGESLAREPAPRPPAALEEAASTELREGAPSAARAEPDQTSTCTLFVRTRELRPVAGARVHLETPAGIETVGTTGADGRLRLRVEEERLASSPVVTGRFLIVWATADGYAISQRTILPWPPEREGDEHPLAIEGAELVLSGRVVDSLGAPVPGARVVLVNDSHGAPERFERSVSDAPLEARSDAGGAFELRHLAQETHTILVHAEGFARKVFQIEGQGQAFLERTVVLATGTAVHGIVRDEAGAPVPGAVVRIRWHAADAPERSSRTTTDEAGRYLLADQPEGLCHLVAEADERSAADVVRIRPGEPLEHDLVLRSVPPLRAQLVDEQGLPFTQARFVFATAGALRDGRQVVGWIARVQPDEHGVVTLERTTDEPVYGGAVALHTGQSFPVGTTRWDGPDPELRRIVCRVEPEAWGSIRGLLLDHLGRPRGGSMLRTHDVASTAGVGTEVLSDGSFLVPKVPPGTYRLSIQERGLGGHVFRDVTVSAAEEADVGALRLPEPGELLLEWSWPADSGYSALIGQLTLETWSPTPITGVHVGGPEDLARVSVLPGRYAVLAYAGERIAQWRMLVVRPGRTHPIALGPDAPLLATFDARAPSGAREATFAFHDAADLDLPPGPLDAEARSHFAVREPFDLCREPRAPDGWFRCERRLALGRWAILVETDDGRATGILIAPERIDERVHHELELE